MSPAKRVFYRFIVAEQLAGARQKAKHNVQPINKPKGIDRDLVKDNALSKEKGEDVVRPDKRDIQPKDVFSPTPNHMGVLNLVETGNDLQKALKKQVPKDKGHDIVHNLSQYLIRTDGNGEEGTEQGK